MSVLHALVVGVSNYESKGINDLPFCTNDILVFTQALINGLKAEKDNIISCGNNGYVYKKAFDEKMHQLLSCSSEEDTIIFYFSGHGGSWDGKHHLMLSDKPISTEEIISTLEKAPAKNKVICLDACMSGNFQVGDYLELNIEETVDSFAGKGYAVFASCSSDQYSYGHPEKPVSLFTDFLCYALTSKYIVRQGKRSLYDIKKLLFLYLDVWNKNNPNKCQTPIFRANMGGTIYFDAEEYNPYIKEEIYEEFDDYIIYEVEPLHNSIAKRYAVKVILKKPLTFEEIAKLNQDIVIKLKSVEIYQNQMAQNHWRGLKTNLLFCYFGFDEEDIANSNYLCHTTWVDETQDKAWWYRMHKNDIIIDDIHFNIHTYYESLKRFNGKHTADKDSLIAETRKIMASLISLAEKVIGMYNEYQNKTISEYEFIKTLIPLIPLIDKNYFAETALEIPPLGMHEWSQSCSNLAATVQNMTLFYSGKALVDRTSENRAACMDGTIKQYYSDLDAYRLSDNNLRLT